MNETKIEWCDSTWNPVTGCRHGCEYCYAQRIAKRFGGWYNAYAGNNALLSPCEEPAVINKPMQVKRGNGKLVQAPFPFGFEPTFHRYRLDEPYQRRSQNIFVCSMADLFGEWVPDEWIAEVFKSCRLSPQHRYLFLTKNPQRYMRLAEAGLLPEEENFWYGSSVPTPDTLFWWSDRHNTFVSIEPMLTAFPTGGDSPVGKVKWVIMGAMTGPGSSRNQPRRAWVEALAKDAQAAGVPVFMKDSLVPFVSEAYWRRDFPWPDKEEKET